MDEYCNTMPLDLLPRYNSYFIIVAAQFYGNLQGENKNHSTPVAD